MSAKTDYLENLIINYVLRTTPVYVGLLTAISGEAGTGTEVTGGSYARQAITFAAPSNGTTSNTTDILFPTATAPWGTIPYFAIFDSASGGNMLYYGTLSTTKIIGSADTATFVAGNLQVAEL